MAHQAINADSKRRLGVSDSKFSVSAVTSIDGAFYFSTCGRRGGLLFTTGTELARLESVNEHDYYGHRIGTAPAGAFRHLTHKEHMHMNYHI